MLNKIYRIVIVLCSILQGCATMESSDISPAADYASMAPGGTGNQPGQSGVITAGEWNDLDNWAFWDKILAKDDFTKMPSYWGFFNKNRVSVHVTGPDSLPVMDAKVVLKQGGNIVFSAKTDNQGNAELWAGLFQENATKNLADLKLDINNGTRVISNVKSANNGINKVVISNVSMSKKIEIAFVVDATGSMGDEISYLKTELLDVITRVKNDNSNADLLTSSVFYRDKGDDYVTRVSDFTENISKTIDFIKDQQAGGGGDFPEAVHSALDKAVNELQWSPNAKTRIIFLLLDAPPHHDQAIISDVQKSVKKAAEKGIKIIPITASGIDKETEFLMRFISISTNSTYVFITNDSGIGNDHLEPTVGEYKVEFLNNLMVRLINKYAK